MIFTGKISALQEDENSRPLNNVAFDSHVLSPRGHDRGVGIRPPYLCAEERNDHKSGTGNVVEPCIEGTQRAEALRKKLVRKRELQRDGTCAELGCHPPNKR